METGPLIEKVTSTESITHNSATFRNVLVFFDFRYFIQSRRPRTLAVASRES